MKLILLFICLILTSVYSESTSDVECKTFEEIYGSGTNLCEKMWGDAFVVSDDNDKAYTMWWFGETNPGDAVTDNINGTSDATDFFTNTTEFCHLDYFHREEAAPLTDDTIECHPWKDDACCDAEWVAYPGAFEVAYGKEYLPDRCGKMSPACYRFFVYEGCFYECDPHIGLYRKWHPDEYDECCDPYSAAYAEKDTVGSTCYGVSESCSDSHNTWEVYQMPIQKDFCDSWYDACKFDKFCSLDDGNFFSCAAKYEELDTAEVVYVEEIVKVKLTDGEIAGIVIGVVIAVIIIIIICIFYFRAKSQRDKAYK